MTIRALIVEDERRPLKVIKETLASLGHDYDWVTNQEDAREKVKANDYGYVLLDLRIPARPTHSFSHIDHGFNLLNDIQTIKGAGRLPVIVMTGQWEDALNIVRELLANGATAIMSKPFPATGRTLSVVIREALAGTRGIPSPGHALDPLRRGPKPESTCAQKVFSYLSKHGSRSDISCREIAGKVGYSRSMVARTRAWKAYQQRRLEEAEQSRQALLDNQHKDDDFARGQ